MRWLQFLSRLAFICNVFFLLGVSMLFFQWVNNGDAASTVIVLGFFMAAILNPLVTLSAFLLLFLNRRKLKAIPTWLLLSNFLLLLLQIMYLIFRNGR